MPWSCKEQTYYEHLKYGAIGCSDMKFEYMVFWPSEVEATDSVDPYRSSLISWAIRDDGVDIQNRPSRPS